MMVEPWLCTLEVRPIIAWSAVLLYVPLCNGFLLIGVKSITTYNCEVMPDVRSCHASPTTPSSGCINNWRKLWRRATSSVESLPMWTAKIGESHHVEEENLFYRAFPLEWTAPMLHACQVDQSPFLTMMVQLYSTEITNQSKRFSGTTFALKDHDISLIPMVAFNCSFKLSLTLFYICYKFEEKLRSNALLLKDTFGGISFFMWTINIGESLLNEE